MTEDKFPSMPRRVGHLFKSDDHNKAMDQIAAEVFK
jgi:hypothetical protein